MKKYISCLVLLTMVFTLLTGCGKVPEPAEPTVPETTKPEEASISTVDGFLEALGSDRELLLEPGVYDLTTASGYGLDTDILRWNRDTGALWIQGLQDLTIRGRDAEIRIGKGPGGPLGFENCSGLHLEGLTLTHSPGPEPEPFTGEISALSLRECESVSLDDLTLRDPIPCLLDLTGSRDVTLTDSLLTGGTGCAIGVSGCEGVTVEGCTIKEICLPAQQYAPGMPALTALVDISAWDDQGIQSKDIVLKNNSFADNRSGLLAFVQDSRKVFIQDNRFTGNAMEEAAFCIWTAQPHIFGNTFEANEPWVWYYPSSQLAQDEAGADMTPERFSPEPPLPEAGPQKEVRVSTAEEFLKAIGPDTRILVEARELDLSTSPDYGTGSSDWYFWEEQYDGPSLVISGVNNLTITAQDEDHKAHTISALPRYANVLEFRFCTNITVSNLTCGHTREPGYCMGGVLAFRDCRNTRAENCGLFGCGILGVMAFSGEDLQILDCDIYECSQGGVSIRDVNGVTIENTTFRDLGGDALYVRDCRNATLDGAPIPQG